MNIIALARTTLRKLTLIGLMLFPFGSMPSYAVELVGKPVAAGRPPATTASSAQVSSHQGSADSASAATDAAAKASISATQESEMASAEQKAFESSDEHSTQHMMSHAMDEMRTDFSDHDNDSFGDFMMNPDTIIPVVAMLLLFGGPVLLVIVLAILHYRAKSRRQQNINMNIDKLLAAGRDIPVELLLGDEAPVIKTQVKGGTLVFERNDILLEKGIKNVGVGIGLLVFLIIFVGFEIASCAFILIGLGISRLIIWRLSAQKSEVVKVQG